MNKGPFVLGSSVSISTLDAEGNPAGQVFETETINDLGEFSLSISYRGPVRLEASGFYYNEAAGGLSSAPIALRALYEIDGTGEQAAHINLITHLSTPRATALLRQGMSLAQAVAQAESELIAGLGIGPSGFEPASAGIAMNIAGGATLPNAYLFAVSTVLSFDARGDAQFQERINTIASDLALDGTITAETRARLETVQDSIRVDFVTQAFRQRLDSLGSDAEIPNLDLIFDRDRDGVVNADDNCRFAANPSQADADTDGVGDECDCGEVACFEASDYDTGLSKIDFSLTTADFNEDGLDDLVVAHRFEGSSASVLLANGSGGFGPPISLSLGVSAQVLAGDFDGDTHMDLAVMPPGDAWQLRFGNGDGSFGSAVAFKLSDFGLGQLQVAAGVGRMNADGRDDLVVVTGERGSGPCALGATVLMGRADRGFDAGAIYDLADEANAGCSDFYAAVGETTGDANADVVVSFRGADKIYVASGDGAGAFSSTVTLSASAPELVSIGDVDNDGNPDIFADAEPCAFFLADGAGGFSSMACPSEGRGIACNVNGDSFADYCAVEAGRVFISVGASDGSFSVHEFPAPALERNGRGPVHVITADIDDDGKDDFIAVAAVPGTAALATVLLGGSL